MKQIIISIIVVLSVISTFAQAQVKTSEELLSNNTQNKTLNETVVFQLFPTQNIWTFIKLNTRNGQMWQAQIDVQGNNRFETILNSTPFVIKSQESNGRFMLYSTQNIYTFILLDQLNGKMWQVQWAIEPDNRVIVPIE